MIQLWPLCLGQAAVALLLFLVLCGMAAINKQAEKANERLARARRKRLAAQVYALSMED